MKHERVGPWHHFPEAQPTPNSEPFDAPDTDTDPGPDPEAEILPDSTQATADDAFSDQVEGSLVDSWPPYHDT